MGMLTSLVVSAVSVWQLSRHGDSSRWYRFHAAGIEWCATRLLNIVKLQNKKY